MSADFLHKRILVLGAGREGLSVVQYILHLHPDADITLADTSQTRHDIGGVTQLTGTDYPTTLADWDVVVVSPGIPPHTQLLQTAQAITTATNIFFEDVLGAVVAVTGSKGKSTTSSLIAAILKHGNTRVHLVGNIGTPALDVLREHNTRDELFVYELSSYQASRLVQGPDVAVIVNLFPEHLDYHGGVEQYYRDKLRITTTQTADQVVFYNSTNNELAQQIAVSKAQKVSWPDERGAHHEQDGLYYGTEKIIALNEIPLLGTHNIENCLGAISIAKYFQVQNQDIATAIRSFTPLRHRLQPVGTYQHITFYDDAISTTPESTLAALSVFPNVGCILLGGLDRGYDFRHLAQVIAAKEIPTIIFFPDTGSTIRAAIEATGYTPKHIMETRSMEEAVMFAYAHTPHNTVCLLSCASPSYSVFKNFEDKGDQFQHWVKKLS